MTRGTLAAMPRASFAFLLTVVVALAFAGVGCPCVRNAVNAGAGLRWWLFSSFAASRVCPEMLKRGVPLKHALLGPSTVGRFFPSQCAAHVDDATRTLTVDVTGQGYAVLPLAQRVGFYAGVKVEFRPDFRLEEDATYVWGRFNRVLAPPDLRLVGVENALVNLATRTPLGDLATVLGRGIVESELSKGFTVVRLEDGDDFTLGILTPPARPTRAFRGGADRAVLGSDVVALPPSVRDYLGPYEVTATNAALYMHMRVTGAPLDFVVVDRLNGETWRQVYQSALPLGPPPGQPVTSGHVPAGELTQTIPLAPGSYFFVVENRAPSTRVLGLPMPFEQRSELMYSAELGER